MRVTVYIDDDVPILDDLELIADINGTSVQDIARRLIEYDLIGHMQLAMSDLIRGGGESDESNSSRNDMWL